MKLRVLDDSVRLRLARSEVDAIATGDEVTASTHFPGNTALGYVLCCRNVNAITAALEGATLRVTLPAGAARAWAVSDEVSLRAMQPLEGGRTLAILVEKDFECVAPREGESQSDRFPNPKSGSDCA